MQRERERKTGWEGPNEQTKRVSKTEGEKEVDRER